MDEMGPTSDAGMCSYADLCNLCVERVDRKGKCLGVTS